MKYLLINMLVIMTHLADAQLPTVVSGTLKRHENFHSQFITARNIDVWLPQGYTTMKKYSVLYLQDGQMLFDSNLTWNKSAWDADDVIAKLLEENKIRDVIVVAAWNGGMERHSEYCPQQPFESLSPFQQDYILSAKRPEGTSVFNNFKVKSDAYLKFLVTELKPFIDNHYSTHTKRNNTYIAGSSMGALIALYAVCQYPDVFGRAGCLSTHWPVLFSMINNPMPDAIYKYLKGNLPNPKSHKIYFDYGTATLDSMYAPLQKQVDDIMIAKGYSHKNWITLQFTGSDHSEKSWKNRFDQPVMFLLRKK